MGSVRASLPGAASAALLVALLVAAPLAGRAASQCAYSNLTASSFGTGTGVCSSSTLMALLDTGTCRLHFGFAADEFHCGNTYLTQHLLILGLESFPSGVHVGSKFLPDSLLYVSPLVVLGPVPGASSDLPLPHDAILIGVTFYAQAAPTFITTVSLPLLPETGLSSALALTLR